MSTFWTLTETLPSPWLTPPCEGLIKAGRRYILEGKEAILKVLMGEEGSFG